VARSLGCPRRRPRRGLNLDAVIAAATDVADRETLEAVTMRRVAQALDVAPMTLYTYLRPHQLRRPRRPAGQHRVLDGLAALINRDP
jgi:hypothetical protein